MNRVVLVLVLEFHDYSSTKDEDEDEVRFMVPMRVHIWRSGRSLNRSREFKSPQIGFLDKAPSRRFSAAAWWMGGDGALPSLISNQYCGLMSR